MIKPFSGDLNDTGRAFKSSFFGNIRLRGGALFIGGFGGATLTGVCPRDCKQPTVHVINNDNYVKLLRSFNLCMVTRNMHIALADSPYLSVFGRVLD